MTYALTQSFSHVSFIIGCTPLSHIAAYMLTSEQDNTYSALKLKVQSREQPYSSHHECALNSTHSPHAHLVIVVFPEGGLALKLQELDLNEAVFLSVRHEKIPTKGAGLSGHVTLLVPSFWVVTTTVLLWFLEIGWTM